MTDQTSISINSSGRVAYATGGLLFCAALVCYLIKYGNPANGLHATAMTGALVIGAGLLGILVSPSLVDFIAALKGQVGGKPAA